MIARVQHSHTASLGQDAATTILSLRPAVIGSSTSILSLHILSFPPFKFPPIPYYKLIGDDDQAVNIHRLRRPSMLPQTPALPRSSNSSQLTLTTSPQDSSRHSVLLPEIWLLIIPYLKPHDLQSISLTCSTFRYMAQPLLFSVLDVSPFLLSHNADKPILRPRKYLDRLVERLEYYKLPHIVHGVHYCWISPYSRSGFPTRNQEDDLEPHRVIDVVVDTLHHFPNLSKLSWHCIDVTPRWCSVIQSLNISTLWLNSTSIPPSIASPLPNISHLDLDHWPWEGRVTNHVSIHEEGFDGVGEFALQHLVQPDVIRSISVPRADTACNLFAVLSQTKHGLRSLKIPFSSISDPNFIPALEQCPGLVSLCILPPSSDDRSRDITIDKLSPSALPSLAIYEGPYTHVLQFSGQPLKSVILWGLDDRPPVWDPGALVDKLVHLAETSTAISLKSLNMSVVEITLDLLKVLASFKFLENIVIQSQDSSSNNVHVSHPMKTATAVTSLYNFMNKISLPPNVTYVKLSTRLGNRRVELAEQEHHAASFMESFASRHPRIQRMEIGYGIYWTGMYSAVWGRIRENSEQTDSSVPFDGAPIAGDNAGTGYSSKSSSRDYIFSTVVSTVHPLPLGKLTFTEHRRTILFPNDTSGLSAEEQELRDMGERRLWTLIWMRFRRLLGKITA